MTLSWNVRDTGVFNDLAAGLMDTLEIGDDIRSELDDIYSKVVQEAEQAKSAMRARISILEAEISDLKRKSTDMRRRGEPSEAVDAEIGRKTKELEDRRGDLARIEEIENTATDSKLVYDKSFDQMSKEYSDHVKKSCKILNQFSTYLAQSRM